MPVNPLGLMAVAQCPYSQEIHANVLGTMGHQVCKFLSNTSEGNRSSLHCTWNPSLSYGPFSKKNFKQEARQEYGQTLPFTSGTARSVTGWAVLFNSNNQQSQKTSRGHLPTVSCYQSLNLNAGLWHFTAPKAARHSLPSALYVTAGTLCPHRFFF